MRTGTLGDKEFKYNPRCECCAVFVMAVGPMRDEIRALRAVYEAARALASNASWRDLNRMFGSRQVTVVRNDDFESLRDALTLVASPGGHPTGGIPNAGSAPPSAGKGGETNEVEPRENGCVTVPAASSANSPPPAGGLKAGDSPTPASAVCECGHEVRDHDGLRSCHAAVAYPDILCECRRLRPATTSTPPRAVPERETPGPTKGGWCDLCSKLNWAQCSTDNVRCPNCGKFWCREHVKSHPEPAAPPVEKGSTEQDEAICGHVSTAWVCVKPPGHDRLHASEVRQVPASIPIADLEALAERWEARAADYSRGDAEEVSAGGAVAECADDLRALIAKGTR